MRGVDVPPGGASGVLAEQPRETEGLVPSGDVPASGTAAAAVAPEVAPIANALLGLPGVRGVVVAMWDAGESPAHLLVGSLPVPAGEAIARTRAAFNGAAAPTELLPVPELPDVLVAPLMVSGFIQGALLLHLDGATPCPDAIVRAVAAGLTAALHHWQGVQEMQRLKDAMEERVGRMRELAAAGQAAASIAHELRNPLCSIKAAAQFLQGEYRSDPTLCEFLAIILDEVEALTETATDFLDFARPLQLDLRETRVHESIARLVRVLQQQAADRQVAFSLDLSDDLPPIGADAQRLEQALRNVILNGVQAMEHGGTLSIATRHRPTPEPAIDIIIADTGAGMSDEHLSRLFTPFFTTRPRGIGLGLTIVKKIVTGHGGAIAVESQVGRGTTFVLSLPVEPRPAPETHPDTPDSYLLTPEAVTRK